MIMKEFQDIRQPCTDEFKNLAKLLNEKKGKEKEWETCIVNELHDCQQKHQELTMQIENYESENTVLQKTIDKKSEKVKKVDKKLAHLKNERDELQESIEKEFVPRADYAEICEELEELKKTN